MTEKSVTEASQDFYINFKAEYQAIDLDIQNSTQCSKTNLTQHFNSILQKINNLEKQLTKATDFIPSYDERQCFKQLKELNQKFETVKAELTPKAKFSFKSRKNKPVEKETLKETTTLIEKTTERDVLSEATVLLKDQQDAVLTIKDNQNRNMGEKSVDVLLSNLKDCVVLLEDTHISAVHVKQVENCVIHCGKIEGSVLIYGMKNSVLFAGCHQLRMHEAYHVKMMLHVTSRPIIEDSNQILVGSWNIQETTNYYDQLEDFNWLKKQASPHWTILDQDLQKKLVDSLETMKENKDNSSILSIRSQLISL